MEEQIAELISTTMVALESATELTVSPPPVLYHFTDASGLIGIIQNGHIWATRAACMNDATEMTYGLTVARRVLEKRKKGEAKAIVAAALDYFDASSPKSLRVDAFIASFCSNVEKSVHWLHYGRKGHGYAIGFDSTKLSPPDWQSVPVLYDEEAQESVLNYVYDAIESKGIALTPSRLDKLQVWGMAAELLVTASRILAPCFKNRAFSEEEEWRVYKLHMESHKTSAKFMVTPEFRESNGRIIPYLNLELTAGNDSPIKEIVVGYQVDPTVTSESLRFLFRKAGLREPTVRKSMVPVQ